MNPTGIVATEEEMRGLAELCRRRNVLLISDEVYRAFCYDGKVASPAAGTKTSSWWTASARLTA